MAKINEESRHLDMMRHPERWPQSFLLPLQHRTRREPDGTMGLLGFMVEDTEKRQAKPRVYIGLMYEAVNLHLLPFEDYPDLDAVVANGWEVN